VVQRDPATRVRLVFLRRRLLEFMVCALAWTLMLVLSGGFVVSLGPLRVSSRNPRPPLLLALVCLIGAAVVSRALGVPLLPWVALWGRFRKILAFLRTFGRQCWIRGRQLWIQARPKIPAAMPVAFVIAAAVLDFHQLFGAAPLWLDEEMIALNFRDRSFSELGGRLWLEQSAPYGWLVVQRAVLLTLGSSEVALRLVPTLFGIATYVAALWIAKRWLTRPAGLVFVLMCILGRALSHYRVEVKHYSGDAFWALLLPALAVWATEGGAGAVRRRRVIIWWLVAATGLWLANGALLVLPACALLVLATTVRRDGARAASKQAAWGLVWFASFALHYAISLRYTAHLREYWAGQFPPRAAGWLEALRWLGGRLDQIATDVGGSDAGVIFWVLAACGLVWSARTALGLVFGGVVVSGFVFALLRLVPMYDRFSLWMVPALYAGIALVIDRAVRSARDAARAGKRLQPAWMVAIAAAAIVPCAGILRRGVDRLHLERRTENHGVDDRTAVSWLISHRQPADVLISTRLGLPALWWYGRISIAGDGSEATHGMYTVEHRRQGLGCGLADALKEHRRVLVYIGFPDMPKGFDELLFAELNQIGTISAYREEAALSRAAVVDLGAPRPDTPAFVDREPRPAIDGCVVIRPAVRR
jgi:FtsH-binding integral membrane protein